MGSQWHQRRGQHKMNLGVVPTNGQNPGVGGARTSIMQAWGHLWEATRVTQLAAWGKTPTPGSRTSHASYWSSTHTMHQTPTKLSFQLPWGVYGVVPITHIKKLRPIGLYYLPTATRPVIRWAGIQTHVVPPHLTTSSKGPKPGLGLGTGPGYQAH